MYDNDTNSFFNYLESQQTAQQFLRHCYEQIGGINASVKSYENCNAFLYYLEHGRKHYSAAKNCDFSLKPVLLFYGLVHLIKACLLTKRPNYPESTSLLAHGVSTRKKKKKNYSFLEDEVKVQHNGLFPYFSKHLHAIDPIPFQKITMETLLGLIPEITNIFNYNKEQKLIKIGSTSSTILQFPMFLLDQYHLTKDSFIRRIEDLSANISFKDENKDYITFSFDHFYSSVHAPFFFHMDDSIFFPTSRERYITIRELMIHYLLLYNLSMICRYETEWWGDLLHTKPDIDYPLIKAFLQATVEKGPYLIGQYLQEKL